MDGPHGHGHPRRDGRRQGRDGRYPRRSAWGKSDRRRISITSPLHQRTSKWDGEELEEQDLEEGVRVGDPRKSTFLLPSFDDDSEGEEETR